MIPKLVLALVSLAAVGAPLALRQNAAPAPSAPPSVVADEHNVAASALIGDWVPDVALWERLQGKALELPPGAKMPVVTFARDDAVAARLPAAVHEQLKQGGLYLTGTIRNLVSEEPAPFVLTTVHGNPHVVWFRARGSDPLGDAESFNVSVVIARQPSEDLLFVGSDSPTRKEAFKPFRRAPGSALIGKKVAENVGGRLRVSQVAVAKADILTIEAALTNYAVANQGRYPDDLQALVTKDEHGFTFLEGDEVPKDPWGRDYVYAPPSAGQSRSTIRCLGSDGKPGGAGDAADFDNHMIRSKKI
jgi:general secretion pathway protein G